MLRDTEEHLHHFGCCISNQHQCAKVQIKGSARCLARSLILWVVVNKVCALLEQFAGDKRAVPEAKQGNMVNLPHFMVLCRPFSLL